MESVGQSDAPCSHIRAEFSRPRQISTVPQCFRRHGAASPTVAQQSENRSADAWAEILPVQRRRYLLYCLQLSSGPLTLAEIAHQLAVWESPDAETVARDERQHIYTSLYHDHLPALLDAELLTYSPAEDLVDHGPAAAAIEPALHRVLPTDIEQLLEAEGEFIQSPNPA